MKRTKKTGALLMALLLVVSFLPMVRSYAASLENTNLGGGSGPTPPVELMLEGNAFSGSAGDFYNELKLADAHFEIYADAGAGYQTMAQLIAAGVVTARENGCYEFETGITSVKLYVTYDVDKYELSAFGGVTIGNSESTDIDFHLWDGKQPGASEGNLHQGIGYREYKQQTD